MARRNELEFSLHTDQRRYAFDEPIYLTLRLTNRGKEPLTVNGRLGLNRPRRAGDAWIEWDDTPEEPRFAASVNIGPVKDAAFERLAPGKSCEKRFALRTYFQFTKGGEYRMHGIYRNEANPTEGEVWTGELKSEPITFTMEPETGQGDEPA